MNIADEPLISLRDAAALLPGRRGKPRHWKTLWRWATAGLQGVFLETVFNGDDLCTSLDALQRFIDARTEARRPNAARFIPQARPSGREYAATRRQLLRNHGI